ncbi:MAG: DUF2868 domain-containing protein [Cyclonatronaceae bacterium]
MDGTRNNAPSRLEILTGLSLFDAGSMTEERIREYRQLGIRLDRDRNEATPTPDTEKLSTWYRDFMPEGIRETAATVTGYLRLVSIAVGFIAFLTGTGAAAYLFYYDGTEPINVLPVLTVFALLPLALLLFSVGYGLTAIRHSGHLPPVFRWIEGPVRSRLRKSLQGRAVNATEAWLVHSEPVSHFLKQNLQLAGAAYLTGALLWMLFNVITTDLAFSWSSTLEMRGETLYSITRTISAPWASMVPAAVVDRETVEATRYFRAGRGDIRDASSGRWWPFIFMAVLTYGFLPRALAFAWYRWRFRQSTDMALLASDTGREIIGYMENPLISTTGDDQSNAADSSATGPERPVDASNSCVVLLWGLGDTDTTGIHKILNRRILSARHIGGLNTTEEDRQILRDSIRLSLENGHCDILVVVPYEESPTIRLEKKLQILLQESRQSRIIIVPVTEDPPHKKQINEINWRSRMDEINRKHGRKRVLLDVRNLLDRNILTGIP